MNEIRRGRPHKWNPQIIAGWRYAKCASIAETARKFMVSTDTVKRACRDQGEGALLARQAWFNERWVALHDRLLFVFENRGGYRPVVANLSRRIEMLEAGVRETEAAMAERGIAHAPSVIGKPKTRNEASANTQQWAAILGIGEMDDDFPEDGSEWNLSASQEHYLGW